MTAGRRNLGGDDAWKMVHRAEGGAPTTPISRQGRRSHHSERSFTPRQEHPGFVVSFAVNPHAFEGKDPFLSWPEESVPHEPSTPWPSVLTTRNQRSLDASASGEGESVQP